MSERAALRAVADTNLFVSGALNPAGRPRRLLRAFLEEQFELLLSEEQLAELTDVFRRPTFVRDPRITVGDLVELFVGLAAAPLVAPSSTIPIPLRDPKDEHILPAALGGNADYLVTGDADLLVLQGDPRLGSLQIVTAVQFLAILDAQPTCSSVQGERGRPALTGLPQALSNYMIRNVS
jgi:putative PIN family toxin of toxin-antitoxin system